MGGRVGRPGQYSVWNILCHSRIRYLGRLVNLQLFSGATTQLCMCARTCAVHVRVHARAHASVRLVMVVWTGVVRFGHARWPLMLRSVPFEKQNDRHDGAADDVHG